MQKSGDGCDDKNDIDVVMVVMITMIYILQSVVPQPW